MTTLPVDRIRPLYAFLDPAAPKRGREGLKFVASRSALVVGGQDDLGRIFVLYAWADRCSTDKLVNKLFEIADRFQPKLIGCEENALAGLFTDAMRAGLFQQRRLPLTGVTQPGNIQKDYRIRTTLQPLIANGRIFLRGNDPGTLELRAEIATFPMNHKKDMIDALASLCRLMPLRHGRPGIDEEQQAYLQYLRESGAAPDVIREAARATSRSPVASGGVPRSPSG